MNLQLSFSYSKWVWQALFDPNCHTVFKSCKNQGLDKFFALFDTKRVSEIYDSYFDVSHVTA